jgi:D-alanyl-D-alanine carboxypeptidase
VASPEDLSKLVIAASKNRTIREYSTDKRYAVRVHKRLVEFHNTDNLVANPTWNIIVQKTGYITEAGKCLVMAAVIEGRSVVIVLLDSLGKYTRVADAKRIKTWMVEKSRPLCRRGCFDGARPISPPWRRPGAKPRHSCLEKSLAWRAQAAPTQPLFRRAST